MIPKKSMKQTTEKDFFAKEGFLQILIAVILTLLCTLIHPSLGVVAFLWLTFCLVFFRNPKRAHDKRIDGILSPADGKILAIKDVVEPFFLKEKRQCVTIFMSPLNVHMNRIPMTGTIQKIHYHKGKFSAAFHEKSSEHNESNAIHLKTDDGEDIVFIQIAGWMARRIVCYAKPDERWERGQIYGMIKFGSRMDIFLPQGYELTVAKGQLVKAGETWLTKKKI